MVRLAGGQVDNLVNWSADTITLVPGIEARYRHRFGPLQLTVKSLFKYFNTQPIERSTTALSFESSSEWWLNEVDLEWRMPLHLWGRQLRTGAYFSRSELIGWDRGNTEDRPPLPGRGPLRDGYPGSPVARGVRGPGRRILLVGQLLGLDRRSRDQLRVLNSVDPAPFTLNRSIEWRLNDVRDALLSPGTCRLLEGPGA